MPETTYKIYYSSPTGPDGKMWCPGCVAVENILSNIFNKPDGPRAEIVYVGDRPTWKDPNCIYRQEPLKLKGVPVVLKFVDGVVVGGLEEDGILDSEVIGGFLRE